MSGERLAGAERLIVALDEPDLAAALGLVHRLGGRCRFYKVGLELFAAAGPAAVAAVAATGARVFLDLKLHDIPETVARATRAAARGGASLLTVHAAGGAQMLLRAAAVAREEGLQLLAVTVLTSQGEEALREDGITGTVAQAVLRRATLAVAAGVAGVVSSPLEVAALRQALPAGTLLVTPGVRPEGAVRGDDQRRTATARQALQAGATHIVVGRPIRDAADPAAAAQAILDDIAAWETGAQGAGA